MSENAEQASKPEEHTPAPRRKTMGRRAFLGLVASSALLVEGHDIVEIRPLEEKPLKVPPRARPDYKALYRDANQKLEMAIAEASTDFAKARGEFNPLFDFLKLLKGFKVTIVPTQGHLEGAFHYEMLADSGRNGTMPGMNRLLKACAELKSLDEECLKDKESGVSSAQLDCRNIAAKLINAYQNKAKEQLINQEAVQVLLADTLYEMVGISADFTHLSTMPLSESPLSVEKSRMVHRKIGDLNVPLNITIMNPTEAENQALAQNLRRGNQANR